VYSKSASQPGLGPYRVPRFELRDFIIAPRMETISRLAGDQLRSLSRVIFSHADRDGVLHRGAKHFTQNVRTLRLVSPLCHPCDDVMALQLCDEAIAVFDPETVD
jgi:hypothetical protein